MAYRDGMPVAVMERGVLRTLVSLEAVEAASIAQLLARRRAIRVA
jgi:hypothetical protein